MSIGISTSPSGATDESISKAHTPNGMFDLDRNVMKKFNGLVSVTGYRNNWIFDGQWVKLQRLLKIVLIWLLGLQKVTASPALQSSNWYTHFFPSQRATAAENPIYC